MKFRQMHTFCGKRIYGEHMPRCHTSFELYRIFRENYALVEISSRQFFFSGFVRELADFPYSKLEFKAGY
jgi:hypothetical protein